MRPAVAIQACPGRAALAFCLLFFYDRRKVLYREDGESRPDDPGTGNGFPGVFGMEVSMYREEIRISHHNRTVDGVFYRPEGLRQFPVVLLSHGYNGCKTDFETAAEYFSQNGIGAVCFTFCGGSTRDVSGFPTTEMTLFTEKEDLCAVLDEVMSWGCTDRRHIYLFGASQGGMISALTAEEREKDIDGLILLYPALCIADDWNRRFPNREEIPDTQELWGMLLGRRFFESIRDFDIRKQIGRFRKRVLVLHGADDAVVPVSYGEWAASAYPNARLEIFQKEGHGFTPDGDRRMEGMTMAFVHECMEAERKGAAWS